MNKKFWNAITIDGVTRILLYGDVGDGCQVDSARVVAELMSVAAVSEKIEVHINSKGGDVFSGIAIYNALKNSPSNIAIYIDGVAASIAAIIALCGKPLYMSRHAKLMLHAVSGGVYGTAEELRQTAKTIEQLEEDLAAMIADRCKNTPEEVLERYFKDGADHWLTAQEANDLGIIDGIVEELQAPPSDKTEDIYNFINQLRNEHNNQDMVVLDEIKKMPAFAGKTDEEIVACVRNHANDAAKVSGLEQANQQYKARIAELEAKEVTAILDQAVAEGRITKEQVPTYTALMASDRENTESLLKSLPKREIRVDNFIMEGKKSGNLSDMTWDELDVKGKLMDLKASDPATFAAKFEEKFGVAYKD